MTRKIGLTAGLTILAIALVAPAAQAHQACISVPDRAVACNRDAVAGDPAHFDHYVDASDRNADGLAPTRAAQPSVRGRSISCASAAA